MAKEGDSTASAYWRDLFSLEVYKRSQGRLARQVTFAVLAFAIALGAWSLKNTLTDPNRSQWTVLSIAGGVLAVGVWVAFRVVNMPRFADFLIAVEAEMNKVSWPTRLGAVSSFYGRHRGHVRFGGHFVYLRHPVATVGDCLGCFA